MDWQIPISEALLEENITKFVHFAPAYCDFDGSIEALVVNWIHPLMLSAKTDNTNGDNPNWIQATNGPFAGQYWEAAVAVVETMERMKASEVAEREVLMNVLSYNWSLKFKRFPDGLINKSKAHFLCQR